MGSDEEKKKQAAVYNVEGDALYNEGKYDEAKEKYQQALLTCPKEEVEDISVYQKNIGRCISCQK